MDKKKIIQETENNRIEKKDTTKILTIIGLLLTLVALGFSIDQYKKAKELTDSISTRYIGEFPKHLSDINKMIDKAEKEIIIFQDVIGYGIFSQPKEFHKFMTTLVQKNAIPITIKVCIYTSKLYEETREYQFIGFEDAYNYKKLKNSDSSAASEMREKLFIKKKNENKFKKSRYENFVNFFSKNAGNLNYDKDSVIYKIVTGLPSYENITYDVFNDALSKIQNYLFLYCKEYLKFSIEPVDRMHVMNCWMIDGKKAIFGFPINYNADEITFTTNDAHITKYVSDMWNNAIIAKGKQISDEY